MVLVGLGLLLFSFFFLADVSKAASLDSFDVIAELPDNQRDKQVKYFDLLMKPDQETILKVSLVNRLDTKLPLELSFNKAVTNGSGVVEYSGALKDTSKSSPYNIEEVVQLADKTVTLEPNQTKEIQLKVKMPNEELSGVLAGGLYVKQLAGDDKQEGNITNLFSREIAVLLRTNTAEVKPELVIKKASAVQANSRNVIETVIENTSATYLQDVTIEATVMLGDKKVLTNKNENMKIAPNTVFNYRIPLAGESFESGNYKVNLTVTSGENKWEGQPTFKVDTKEAKSLNQQDVSVQAAKKPIPWSTIILASVLVIVMLVLGYLMKHNRQLKRNLKKKKSKRKSSHRHKHHA